jgi:hypothetical protein
MAGVHLPALKPALDTGAHQRAAALRTRVALDTSIFGLEVPWRRVITFF